MKSKGLIKTALPVANHEILILVEIKVSVCHVCVHATECVLVHI